MPDLDHRTLDCLASRFWAGDSIADLADDYGIAPEQVEAALREPVPPAAQPAPTPGDGDRWQCDSCGYWLASDDRPEDGSSTCMVCAEDAEDEEQEEEEDPHG